MGPQDMIVAAGESGLGRKEQGAVGVGIDSCMYSLLALSGNIAGRLPAGGGSGAIAC